MGLDVPFLSLLAEDADLLDSNFAKFHSSGLTSNNDKTTLETTREEDMWVPAILLERDSKL